MGFNILVLNKYCFFGGSYHTHLAPLIYFFWVKKVTKTTFFCVRDTFTWTNQQRHVMLVQHSELASLRQLNAEPAWYIVASWARSLWGGNALGGAFFALSCYCFFGVLNITKLSFLGGVMAQFTWVGLFYFQNNITTKKIDFFYI